MKMHEAELPKWDRRMLSLADEVASWSRDPSTQVGAVIARPDHTVASFGFNGFPRGVDDAEERYANREVKYALVVHAETNAIVNAHGIVRGHTMYLTLPPCSTCAGVIVQAGIARVVAFMPSAEQRERWQKSMAMAELVLREGGVQFDLVSNESNFLCCEHCMLDGNLECADLTHNSKHSAACQECEPPQTLASPRAAFGKYCYECDRMRPLNHIHLETIDHV